MTLQDTSIKSQVRVSAIEGVAHVAARSQNSVGDNLNYVGRRNPRAIKNAMPSKA